MANQFEYLATHFGEIYMMEVDYDMALIMKNDCIKQLMALRELQPIMDADEFCRLRMLIRSNLCNAQVDIDHYESRYPEVVAKRSSESTI